MTEESFVKIIQLVVDQKERERQLCKALEPFFDGHIVSILTDDLETSLISILEAECDDPFDTVSWWIYDNDCGRGNLEIKEESGETVQLQTAQELYKYLMKKQDEW